MGSSIHYFADRTEAGKILADALAQYAGRSDVLVLALPRGGVPVAHEVAKALAAPMDLWLVRKLGVPGQEELAMGAMAGKDTLVFNQEIINLLNIDQTAIDTAVVREQAELQRRNRHYRQGRPPRDVTEKTVILIDDGLATGATMRAAIASLRQAGAARIVAAVPVGAAATCVKVEKEADEFVCLFTPEPFYGVGQWYSNFLQVMDEEVLTLLANNSAHPGRPVHP